jgi:hypothetical protein
MVMTYALEIPASLTLLDLPVPLLDSKLILRSNLSDTGVVLVPSPTAG